MERTDSGIRRYAKYAAIVICKWMIRIVNRCRSPICWVSWGKWLNRIFVLIEFCCVEFNWECTHFAHSNSWIKHTIRRSIYNSFDFRFDSSWTFAQVSNSRLPLHCVHNESHFKCVSGNSRHFSNSMRRSSNKKSKEAKWWVLVPDFRFFNFIYTKPYRSGVYVSHAHTHTQSQHKLRWI